jgi:hypothetical protein
VRTAPEVGRQESELEPLSEHLDGGVGLLLHRQAPYVWGHRYLTCSRRLSPLGLPFDAKREGAAPGTAGKPGQAPPAGKPHKDQPDLRTRRTPGRSSGGAQAQLLTGDGENPPSCGGLESVGTRPSALRIPLRSGRTLRAGERPKCRERAGVAIIEPPIRPHR